MTMKYILDPMLFALREDISEPDFRLFVRRLIMWDRWLEEHPDDAKKIVEKVILAAQAQHSVTPR